MSKKGNFTEMFIGINIRWYNAIKTQSLIDCINASHTMVNYYYGRVKLYPDSQNVLRAFKFCKPDEIRAVIIGQDPYKGGIADGLSFSTKTGVIQPSLRNIYKSMIATGVMSEMPAGSDCSDLSGWAKQGVLMLNMALMCDSKTGKVHEHWYKYTSEIVSWLSSRNNGIVFFLFGRKAQNLKRSINPRKHHIILEWGHPSPLNKTHPPFEQFRGWTRVNINWSAHSAKKYERVMSQIANSRPKSKHQLKIHRMKLKQLKIHRMKLKQLKIHRMKLKQLKIHRMKLKQLKIHRMKLKQLKIHRMKLKQMRVM